MQKSMCGKIVFLMASLTLGASFTTEISANADSTISSNKGSLENINQKLEKSCDKNSITEKRVQQAVEKLSAADKATLSEHLKENANEASSSSNSGNQYVVKNIGNNFTVVTQTSDQPEDGTTDDAMSPLLRSFTGNVTKKYGDRKYVITTGMNWNGKGLANLGLTMHYTLGSGGITMRSSTTAGTYNLIGSVTGTAKTTDSVATKVGANVNAYRKYTISYVFENTMTFIREVHGSVKINSWNKSAKSMSLYENFYTVGM